jgi:hypothetical protein
MNEARRGGAGFRTATPNAFCAGSYSLLRLAQGSMQGSSAPFLGAESSQKQQKIDLDVGTYHGAESHIAVSKGSESPNPKSDPLETAIWDAAPWSVPRGPSVEIYYGRPSIVFDKEAAASATRTLGASLVTQAPLSLSLSPPPASV